MANSLYPAFVRIEYHSAFGPHTMTIPIKGYDGDISGDTAGNIPTWAGGSIAADDMVEALVDVLKALFDDDTHFDSFTIFTMASAEADPRPAYSQALTQVGTATASVWNKAVEKTLTFRTTEFGLAKLTLMDAGNDGTFPLITPGTATTEVNDIIDEFTAVANGWSGRDNGRPSQFIQMSATLNEKLRRAYRLV